MDADGLPIVGPGIDYTKVGSIHQKRTLAFLNHFITHTVRFLNHFSCVCEEKLETMTVKLQRLEVTMNLLDAKLSSIPGLENVTVATDNTSSSDTSSQPQPSNDNQNTSVNSSQNPVSQPTAEPQVTTQPPSAVPETPSTEEAAEHVEEAQPQNTVAKDPRYAKYFKLMQVGVPSAAFRGKMLAEGLDPDLLETPDAAVPDGGVSVPTTQQTEDSEAEFSEEEEKNKSEEEDSDSSGFSD